MSPSNEFFFDVTAVDFEERVLRRSRDLPVLVDFWATWCGPCQTLMPLLARLATTYQGSFLLAKVNTDIEQPLTQRFGIRSIPTVKLFRNGQVVEEFIGAQSESAIRALLDRHVSRESDKVIPAAQAALQASRPDEALDLLDGALAADPGNERLVIERARALLALGRFDDSGQSLRSLPLDRRDQPAVTSLLRQLDFSRVVASAPPLPELEKRILANAQDHEARYQFAVRCALRGEYDTALGALLEVIRRDRSFPDDAARKAMLTVFTLLGNNHELVRKYRALLASALN